MNQAWIGYKEVSASANTAFEVERYYHTDWLTADELSLKLEGLDIDAVYENFVRQIAGDVLQNVKKANLLKKLLKDRKKFRR